MKTGICSVTFRQFSAGEVVDLVKKAGLDAVEWGGDLHVPHGDVRTAKEVRKLTEDAGLAVSSYGSYYKVLDSEGMPQEFEPVLASTVALGADTVRIWAGEKGSDVVGVEYRQRLVLESRRIAQMSASAGVKVAFEFHNNSLTDTNESAMQLIQDIDHPNIYVYWQPMYWGPNMKCRMDGLETLKNHVLNLHVFHWEYDASQKTWAEAVGRRPLCEGRNEWKQYLAVAFPPRTRYALLEFVCNDDPERFLDDAAELKAWLKE